MFRGFVTLLAAFVVLFHANETAAEPVEPAVAQRVLGNVLGAINRAAADRDQPRLSVAECHRGRKHAADKVFCNICATLDPRDPEGCLSNDHYYFVTFSGMGEPLSLSRFGPTLHFRCLPNQCDSQEKAVGAKIVAFNRSVRTFVVGLFDGFNGLEDGRRAQYSVLAGLTIDATWDLFWTDERAQKIFRGLAPASGATTEETDYFRSRIKKSIDFADDQSCVFRVAPDGTPSLSCSIPPAIWKARIDAAAP